MGINKNISKFFFRRISICATLLLVLSFTFHPPVVEGQVVDGELVMSTYFGGQNNDFPESMVIDSADNVIITGYTSSPNFPVLNGYNNTYTFAYDAFVSKFNSDGVLEWSTFLGGSGDDYGHGITVDANDNIIVVGRTSSSDFPTLGGLNDTFGGLEDIFVTKFSPSGQLMWSRYMGGSDYDNAKDVEVTSSTNIIIGGHTFSTDFPTLNAFDDTIGAGSDGALFALTSNGNISWSTYFGGNGYDNINALDLDSNGNIFAIGDTSSSDFFIKDAYDSNIVSSEAFVSKFSAVGNPMWSTYLGGMTADEGEDITVDGNDNVIVTGVTTSTDFPTRNAYYPKIVGGLDAYVTRFSNDGILLMSTYLGSASNDEGTSVTTDSSNAIILTGKTNFMGFPTRHAYNDTFGGTEDMFLTIFSPSDEIEVSTYLGASNYDNAFSVTLDSNDDIWLSGYTNSPDFPVLNAYNDTYSGTNLDLTISKFTHIPIVPPVTPLPQAQTITVTTTEPGQPGVNFTEITVQTTTEFQLTTIPVSQSNQDSPNGGGEDSFVGYSFMGSVLAMILVFIPIRFIRKY